MAQQGEQYLAGAGHQTSPQYLYIVDAVTAGNDILDLLLTPTLCTAAASYLFWDSINPSASGHQLVAQRALEALGR